MIDGFFIWGLLPGVLFIGGLIGLFVLLSAWLQGDDERS